MLEIHAQWDDEARVWYAISEAVPGLCVEAETFDELVNAATELTPELLELNRVPDHPKPIRDALVFCCHEIKVT